MPTTQISKHMTLKHIRDHFIEKYGAEYFMAVDYWNRYDLESINGHKFYPQSMKASARKFTWAGYKVNGKTGKRTQVKAGSMESLLSTCRFIIDCRQSRWHENRDRGNEVVEATDAAHAAHAGNHEALMAFFRSERRRIGVEEPEEAPPTYAEEDPLAPPAYE
jgi:hypothetical protein